LISGSRGTHYAGYNGGQMIPASRNFGPPTASFPTG